jgi:hypothetical protein
MKSPRNQPSYVRMNRRTALKWFMVAGLSATLKSDRLRSQPTELGKGYGRDPDMFSGDSPWSRTLSPSQIELVAALADIVVPYSNEASPSASDVHVPDFMDEWVSAPYPRQQRDREVILPGLARIDEFARDIWQTSFVEAGTDRQVDLCRSLSGENNRLPVEGTDRAFFRLFTVLVLGGYYTSEVGLKDIGYVGNVPLPLFPGPPPEVLKRIGVESLPW